MTIPKPSHKTFIHGSLWMISMRWSMRLIGFVSTIILARLLTPSDFGIVAMAMIIVALFEIISWTGIDLALLREKEISQDALNTAWTIQILQGVIIATLLFIFAPYAGLYFNESKAVLVIQVLALRPLLEGFQNIGVVFFRKELDFSKEFKFGLYKKLINFILVISLAILLRNYWALVIGMVTATAVGLILSFLMHPYRPKLSLTWFNKIWSFSAWLLFSRIGKFLNTKVDQFIIGGTFGTTVMGNYYMGFQISTLFTNELVMPIRRALFPNLSNMLDNKDRFNNVSMTMLNIVAALCFPIGFGVSATANEFINVVLGSQWTSVIPIVEVLALFATALSLSSALEMLLLVKGKSNYAAIESWLHLITFAPIAYYFSIKGDIINIANMRMIVGSIFVFLSLYLVHKACELSVTQILRAILRPLFASLIMFTCIKLLPPFTHNYIIVTLAIKIIFGAVVYISSLLLLWILFGKKSNSIEELITLYIRKKYMNA